MTELPISAKQAYQISEQAHNIRGKKLLYTKHDFLELLFQMMKEGGIMTLYTKIRPKTFDEVKGQEFTVNNLRMQSIRNKFFQVIILAGQ